ncbi:MAG: DUF3108 domain-containing protein [Candidatus Binataceae bacterium]
MVLLTGAAASPNVGADSARPRRRRAQAARTPDPLPLPVNLRIPQYSPGTIPFHDGETLIYQASWMGIPAAQARVAVHHDRKDPPLWSGEMWITSSKVVDLVYRMRDYIREDFRRATLEPESMHIVQHEKQRYDVWNVTFDHDARLVTSSERDTRGRIKTKRFSGGAPWGPFSGAMMALSQPLTVGETLIFDVFSGGNRYVFAFDVKDRERITTPLGTFDTLRIEPSVLWLSHGEFRSQARASTIWVTAGHHLPVRIESQVFIGFVRADLIQVSGASVPAGVSATTAGSADKSQAPDPPAPATRAPDLPRR